MLNFVLIDAWAKTTGAQVLLRIDDLDEVRVRPEFVEHIFTTLEALAIQPEEGPSGPEALQKNWSQKHRQASYRELLARLQTLPEVYACQCSRKQLKETDCPCQERFLPKNTETALRLSLRHYIPSPWPSFCQQDQALSLFSEVGQSIAIQKKDGMAAYQIASVADDLQFSINHIIRGKDLMASTGVQEYLLALIGKTSPFRYWHHSLSLDASGAKRSKSTGAQIAGKWEDLGLSAGAIYQEALVLAFGKGDDKVKDKNSFIEQFSEQYQKQTAPLGGAVL